MKLNLLAFKGSILARAIAVMFELVSVIRTITVLDAIFFANLVERAEFTIAHRLSTQHK